MSNYTSADSVPVVAHKIGVSQGRALERELIVAWLRNNNDFYAQSWAKDIEAGDHLK
jgi:hypothetical protein